MEFVRTQPLSCLGAEGGGKSQTLINKWAEGYAEAGQLRFHRAVSRVICNKIGYKVRVGLRKLVIAVMQKTDLRMDESRLSICIISQ